MTKYADGPSVSVEIEIEASAEEVWALVTDVDLPARFSSEVPGGTLWLAGSSGPMVGATFSGRNHHPAIGEWETTCFVVACEPAKVFAWSVSDAEHPSASWRFEIEPRTSGGGVLLRQSTTLGPGPSGLTPAIVAMPDKEERIIERRLEEHRRNMQSTLEGIKALVEGDSVTLRIGLPANPYSDAGLTLVTEAEAMGVDSIWSAEAWGFDALTPLAYLAARTERIRLGTAIAQLGSRSPALLAMSALSMQALSGGRFLLGLGTSGPQVMEGWHGVPFTRPVRRTRETIDIIRQVCSGDRLAYDGELYTLPLPGGAGRSIRSSAPIAPVPIYLASLGPANLRLTGELADGWIGTSFLPETAETFLAPIRDGAEAVGRSLSDIDLTVPVAVEFSDDVDEASARHARGYAFTFGAMGSATQNFYKDAFSRQGFAEAGDEVQRLWLAGDRAGAAEAVPREIGFGTNLLGTPDMIRDRLRLYRDAGVNTLRVGLGGEGLDHRLDTIGRLMDLVGEVNAETGPAGTARA